MQRYQIPIPIPTNGINCIDDSIIADSEAAEGTKNISFKNGIPQTRKGYVKDSPFNFEMETHSLFNYVRSGVRYLLAACGTELSRQTGETFTDIAGTLATDKVEMMTYPAALGYINEPKPETFTIGAGTLAAGTYYYRITALGNAGETYPSEEKSIVLDSTGGVNVKWVKVPGSTGYKVYGRTLGAELFMANISDPNTTTWLDNGLVTPLGAMPTANTTYIDYSDKCFILDGAKYQYYDGGTHIYDVPAYSPTTQEVIAYGENVLLTVPNEIKQAKYIFNDNERIWVINGKNVRMSHFQKPDYFPSTHIWKLEEDCTGAAHFYDEALMFGENTATLISGKTPDWSLPETYVYKKLPGGYGCSAHRSISEGNNAVYWANRQGVYRYRYLPTGFTIPECVSEFEIPVKGKAHKRSIKKLLSRADWSKVFSNFYDNEYRLYIGNGQVLVFDTIGSTWALYEYNIDFNCSMMWDKNLYYGSTYLFNMDKEYDPNGVGFEGLNDDGAAIEFRLKSKFFDFDKAANKKRFKKMFWTFYSELISYAISLIINVDNDIQIIENEIINKVSRWGSLAFGDKITTKKTNLNYPIKIHHKGKKFNIQYELVCTEANNAFMLISSELLFKIKELK